jgi:enamine deaminase RidA (YjgF/YER057c/UK114 family)
MLPLQRSDMARKFISSGSPFEALAGYSRAVADGRWVFVSGTVGYDIPRKRFPRGAAAQAEVALDVIERALGKAKAKLSDAVRVRVYISRRSYLAEVAEVVKRRLGVARAANTTVCAPLVVAAAKVEIEVTALRPRRRPSRSAARARPRRRAPRAAG